MNLYGRRDLVLPKIEHSLSLRDYAQRILSHYSRPFKKLSVSILHDPSVERLYPGYSMKFRDEFFDIKEVNYSFSEEGFVTKLELTQNEIVSEKYLRNALSLL